MLPHPWRFLLPVLMILASASRIILYFSAFAVAWTVFSAEIRDAVRYEKGLAVKALIALVLVAVVVLARLLYLA